MVFPADSKSPVCMPGSRCAPNAVLAGDVFLGEKSSVWYGAVLRGDLGGVQVAEESNIQDNCVLHNARVGRRVTVGHAAVLDGCTVEDGCLIGMNATVLSGAVIGAGSLVAAGTLITEGAVIPPGSVVIGVPGKVRGPVKPEHTSMIAESVEEYLHLAQEELPETE